MKRLLLAVIVVFFLTAPIQATASVLDFEDLGYTSQYGQLESYQGFTFDGTNWINDDYYSGAWEAGINGEYAIATRHYGSFTISRSESFDLESLCVTNINASEGYGYISITGYLNGIEVGFYDITSTGRGIQYNISLDSNWDEIDSFKVFADTEPGILGKVVVDDIVYNETSAVPIPGSLSILGFGLAVFSGLRRRKT